MSKLIEIESEKDTSVLAQAIAPSLNKGSVLLLSGDLGTGKTFFASCLCKYLGVTETVNSPTFVIVNQYYSGRIPVFHIDLYRLDSLDEALQLGVEEFCEEGIVIIEWPELIEPLFEEYASLNQVNKLFFRFQNGTRSVLIS